MPEKREKLLEQLNTYSRDRHNLRQVIPILSLLVILIVFWSLKLTGIGIAGEAFCGKSEHSHSNECLTKELICTLGETEAHQHSEICISKTLVCQLEENAEHTHADTCWSLGKGFGCGLLEVDGHTHTAECLTEETELGCNKETTQGHAHTDECYKQLDACPLEEHIHDETCYSDITADIETSDDWEQTLADIARGPTTKENVVLVAQSQLGYTESTLNFQVDVNGIRRGITRYGQWYGNPYGDWSAMFASFCLHYAGVEQLPANAGPEAMRLEWESAGLYKAVAETTPEVGHLIFLHKGENEYPGANAVAIITGFDENTVTVIEGDLDNAVAETQYPLDDAAIMGYGLTPEADAVIVLDEPAVIAEDCTVWLDGTDGGLGHLTGSPNTAYATQTGTVLQLPESWTSPSKYSYKLRGWYDVTNSRYYPAGGEMEVIGNAVLYADWVATTYDIGTFNAQVAETVSTNSFITTHMFDYNYLFNVQASNAQVTVNNRNHSETWSMVTSGNVNYGGNSTIDFIFGEADSEGQISNPRNRDNRNRYQNADTISAGICTPTMRDLLYSPSNAFDPATGKGIIGKTYLGTGDHLFQIMDDPSDEHYGYYYYDSLLNAISYNQTNSRFYVYEYLSATSDAIGSSNADFLPLNSPYANTNGRPVRTYTYNGQDGEYQGVTHYRYDTSETESGVYTEFAYGMRSDINFFLPNDPGSDGNKDLNGNDIKFEFSGDDDLWVLIDGILVLDIGGIHQRIAGEINFSTGEVVVNNRSATSLQNLGINSGDHIMTVLYLERGASMSNCSIYFNLVPRIGLEIKKEDALTQEPLDGTQFTVYEDFECTKPAELWESEAAYHQDFADDVLDEFQSTFTVKDGTARLWGLGAGNTYYIKETGPPGKAGYGLAQGVIRLTIDKDGQATYHADVVADADGNGPSVGYTVHGVRIDETTQTVYIVVTNAPETVVETTTVQVIKKWEDTKDHSGDYIQAYLTVTDPDGTVRRIREVTLSDENRWTYIWTNLPKQRYDSTEEVQYGVVESYESGYYSTVRRITEIEIPTTEWAEAATFVDGETYVLKNNEISGANCLSTTGSGTSSTDVKLKWVDEETARESPLALWTVEVSNQGKVKFTNGAGQILTFNNGSSNNNRYFYATKTANNNQQLSVVDAGSGFRIYGVRTSWNSTTNYYMSSLNASNGRITSTNTQNSGMILMPMEEITQTDVEKVGDWAYQITNVPLKNENETSMSVKKEWVLPTGISETAYQDAQVTVRLLANGADAGRTITLNLKNGWQGAFQGLPYKDESGNVIQYSVEEIWERKGWTTTYAEVITSGGSPPNYSVVITNTYYSGGPMLPSTGSAARLMYTLCGWGIILGALVYGIGSRRKRERGTG